MRVGQELLLSQAQSRALYGDNRCKINLTQDAATAAALAFETREAYQKQLEQLELCDDTEIKREILSSHVRILGLLGVELANTPECAEQMVQAAEDYLQQKATE